MIETGRKAKNYRFIVHIQLNHELPFLKRLVTIIPTW